MTTAAFDIGQAPGFSWERSKVGAQPGANHLWDFSDFPDFGLNYITGLTSTYPPSNKIGQPYAISKASSIDSACTLIKPPNISFTSAYGPSVITLPCFKIRPSKLNRLPRTNLFLADMPASQTSHFLANSCITSGEGLASPVGAFLKSI